MFEMVGQYCNDINTRWRKPSSEICPVTGYNVNISGFAMSVNANQTSYTYAINDSVCREMIEISVSAMSAAGTGNVTSMDSTIVCTRKKNLDVLHVLVTSFISFHAATGVSVVSISDQSAVVQWTVSCFFSLVIML